MNISIKHALLEQMFLIKYVKVSIPNSYSFVFVFNSEIQMFAIATITFS